ncbi:ABC transporter substrate-binding protein [Paenarthrobacter nicotinovorans]|uniref:ABC transporter substrate-binding protein n=1 Tax=Paenarthrobacter nicotinovorans TaxID=29320 RepID=UPI00374A4C48
MPGASKKIQLGVSFIASAALMAAMTSCTISPSSQGDGNRDGTIILAVAGEVTSIDPVNADYSQADMIESTLYDTLVSYDSSGKIVPKLATEFTQSADAKSITIKLRDGVKFHDGTPLEASDVVYSLTRYQELGRGVANLISSFESAEATDTSSVKINLKRPDSTMLGALSKIYIVNADLVEKNAGSDRGQTWLQSNDAGSGAYVTKAGPGAGDVTVEAFAGYWNVRNDRPQQLIFRRIDESGTQRDELRAGNIDIALYLNSRDAEELKNTAGITTGSLPQALQTYVFFNTTTGPTADVRVRRAIELAYDYSGGLQGIRGGFGTIANGPLPETLPCRIEDQPNAQNKEEAKKLLADAGAENLKLTMRFQPAFPAMSREATLLQSNLKEIGVDLELQPIAFPDYLKSLGSPDTIPQMALIEDFAQYPDPGVMLIKGYRSTATGTNKAGFSDPKVDQLLDAAEASADATERCGLYKDAQKIINDQVPAINMYTVGQPAGWRSDIKGIDPSPTVLLLAPAETLRVGDGQK